MYADVDFLLAIIKEKDWLKENAEKIYGKNFGKIWTSTIAIQEIMMYCYREKLDMRKTIENAANLVNVKEIMLDIDFCLMTAEMAQKYDATIFDMMHAIVCGKDTIISSDKVFDRLGIKRIKLEEKQ